MEMLKEIKTAMFIIIAIILLFSILLSPILFLNYIGGSSGIHTGIVTAIEFNDNILWDAVLVYFKTSEESTQEDIYCVNDLELKNKLENYAKTRELITISFENDFWFFSKDCNGGVSIITGVN